MALRVKTEKEARAYQLTIDGEKEEIVPAKRERDNAEERSQIALFAIRSVRVEKYEDLRWLYSTLNGIYIPPALLKPVAAAGLTKGVLDLRLDVPHTEEDGTRWSGLCIDMKAANGKPTPEQLEWAQQLIRSGVRAVFATGNKQAAFDPLQDAWWTIASYIGIAGADHYHARLRPEEEYHLAKIQAEANLARSSAQAAKEARKVERSLK